MGHPGVQAKLFYGTSPNYGPAAPRGTCCVCWSTGMSNERAGSTWSGSSSEMPFVIQSTQQAQQTSSRYNLNQSENITSFLLLYQLSSQPSLHFLQRITCTVKDHPWVDGSTLATAPMRVSSATYWKQYRTWFTKDRFWGGPIAFADVCHHVNIAEHINKNCGAVWLSLLSGAYRTITFAGFSRNSWNSRPLFAKLVIARFGSHLSWRNRTPLYTDLTLDTLLYPKP